MTAPVITLLTDYGPQSEYVGALHARIAAADPAVTRVDFAHDIPRGDVRWGALVLARLATEVPGAFHVAVVDPGVGSARRGIAVTTRAGGALIGPDNGLLAPAAAALGATAAVALAKPPRAAATFDGRDVFVPAALRLAAGAVLGELGEEISPGGLMSLPLRSPEVRAGVVRAQVLGRDTFGNVQLGARGEDAVRAGITPGADVRIRCGTRETTGWFVSAFGDVPPGGVLVHVDSHGHLAVAVNGGDAAAQLGAVPGDLVEIVTAAWRPGR